MNNAMTPEDAIDKMAEGLCPVDLTPLNSWWEYDESGRVLVEQCGAKHTFVLTDFTEEPDVNYFEAHYDPDYIAAKLDEYAPES